MHSASTESVRPSERVDYWEDLVGRSITPMCIEPVGGEFRGKVQARLFGALPVAHVSGQGIRASHRTAQIARARQHVCAACIHLEGQARISSRGKLAVLQEGDVFFTDSRYEYTLHLDRPWRHLVLVVPSQWVDSFVHRPELLSGKVVRDHPLGRLWSNHLEQGFALGEKLSAVASRLLARQSVDMLAQLLLESHGGPSTESRHGLIFAAACQVIALKFADPGLTPERIAQDLHVSTRTLARSFAASGQTVMRRVFEERVDRAADLLASRDLRDHSITDIAFRCGFNDSSHFGRVFAAQMQITPTRWRSRNSGRDQNKEPAANPPSNGPSAVTPPCRSAAPRP